MSVNLILFLIVGVACIASALGMLLSRSAVYAALWLVVNFGTVAVFYILLNAPFISMAQITVYGGAIMVLFLFVIMLLGTDQLPPLRERRWQIGAAVGLGLVLVALASYMVIGRGVVSGLVPQAVGTFGSPQAVGQALFNQYLLPFEITSILLLVAIVGAVILTRHEKGGG